MDYKALVDRCRENLRKRGGATTTDVAALCDAVEALEKDANRWRWYATSPQTALMLGSKLDPNSEQDWVAENGRLADMIMRDAFYQAIEASTPTPAAPSDA